MSKGHEPLASHWGAAGVKQAFQTARDPTEVFTQLTFCVTRLIPVVLLPKYIACGGAVPELARSASIGAASRKRKRRDAATWMGDVPRRLCARHAQPARCYSILKSNSCVAMMSPGPLTHLYCIIASRTGSVEHARPREDRHFAHRCRRGSGPAPSPRPLCRRLIAWRGHFRLDLGRAGHAHLLARARRARAARAAAAARSRPARSAASAPTGRRRRVDRHRRRDLGRRHVGRRRRLHLGRLGLGRLDFLGRRRGGGGGMITSWITAASSGFLMISSPLRAVPVTSAQPTRTCTSTTTIQPIVRRDGSLPGSGAGACVVGAHWTNCSLPMTAILDSPLRLEVDSTLANTA